MTKRQRRGWTIEDLAKRRGLVRLRWCARVRDTDAATYRSKSFARRAEAVAFCKEHAPALNKPRKASSYEFKPNWGVHPGEMIAAHLESKRKTQQWLAKRMKRPVEQISRLINYHISVTAETALQLEAALKRPAHFWMNLQSLWDLHLARKKRAR